MRVLPAAIGDRVRSPVVTCRAAPPRMALDGPSQRAFAAAASSPEPLEGDPFGDGAAQFVAWRQVGTLPLRIVHTIPAAPVQQQAIVTMVLAGIACFVVAVMLALSSPCQTGSTASRDNSLSARSQFASARPEGVPSSCQIS